MHRDGVAIDPERELGDPKLIDHHTSPAVHVGRILPAQHEHVHATLPVTELTVGGRPVDA
jgi:hypothetical protein